MQALVLPTSMSALNRSMARPRAGSHSYPPDCTQARQADHQFIAMLGAYRPSGGLARAQEVVELFASHFGSNIATLARWIVQREVICFEWQAKIWLPLFQFNRVDMTLHIGLGPVLKELITVFKAWDLANWFAQPNALLAERTPADTLLRDAGAVLIAARVQRRLA